MKRILSLLLALTVLLSVSIPALADWIPAPDGSEEEIVAIEPGDSTRHEETTWYYRVHNGMLQKRLWSITYGRWLTDWLDVMPYPGS